jgi:outer membrane protein assembly factor BamB
MLTAVQLIVEASLVLAGASDWPQFLGPTRDGVYAGGDLAESWGPSGPKSTWTIEVGEGLSSPVISGSRLVLFHRKGDRETVECLDAATGKRRWVFDYPSGYRESIGVDDNGPRATPAIAGGRVFTLGAEGMAHGLDLETGTKVWSFDAREKLGAQLGYFGIACSPLVEGTRVLFNIGGKNGAGIVALDAATGNLAWKATDDAASYSSPVAATIGGKRHAFFFTRAGLKDIDPETGAVRCAFPWRARSETTVNAATPVVSGDLVFISASYGTGAALLRVKESSFEPVWSSDEALSNHYATSVLSGGFLYGFDGRQEGRPSLRCVELETGKVRWSKEQFGAGSALLANGKLLVLTETGELVLAPASPEGFAPVARAQVLDGTVRAYAAIAGGFIYARNARKLVCLDLRKS